MKKVFLILLATVLAISMVAVGCPDPIDDDEVAPEVIRVGLVRDVSGPMSVFDQLAAGPAWRAWVPYVNDVLGGIYLSKWDVTVPVEVVWVDFGGDFGELADYTEGLIVDEKVDFLWGAPGTDSVFIQAPIAEEYEMVLFTFEGGAKTLKASAGDYRWLFVNLSFSDWYQIPVLAGILEQDLGKDAADIDAYVLYVGSPSVHGAEYLSEAQEHFNVVQAVELPFDETAMDPELIIGDVASYLASDGFDILIMAAYPQHNFPLFGQIVAQGVDLPAVITGPGANFGFFGLPPEMDGVMGPAAEGIMSYTVANLKTDEESGQATDVTSALMQIAAGIEEEAGLPPGVGIFLLDFWGHPLYWAALEMWKAAIEYVGDISNEGLRDALATQTFETILGDTRYDFPGGPNGAGFLSYKSHTGSIGQWQYDEQLEYMVLETIGYTGIETVMPNYVVTGEYKAMQGEWLWLGG